MNSQGAPQPEMPTELLAAIDPILGYLNYGNGSFDVSFFRNLNAAFGLLAAAEPDCETVDQTCTSNLTVEQQPVKADDSVDDIHPLAGCTALAFHDRLTERLAELEQENSAFRDSSQSRFAIEVTFDVLVPLYLKFHRDLFFHQKTEILMNSFFVGRAFELVLREIRLRELDSEDSFAGADRVLFSRSVLRQLNDFTGHRPVATLESQKLQPYANERFRPVPVYIQGVGVAHGRYHDLLTETIRLIEKTDEHILRAAEFSLDRLKELSIDPRAFDFDHPINQRPNHHFGQWDDDTISLDGYFERFIFHAVTLEALLDRIDACVAELPPVPYSDCLLYTSPSPRDKRQSRMPSSA